MVASMVVAVAAQYRPNPRWPDRTDCQLQVKPAAGARTSVPVTAKFAAWTRPRGPSASELTGWREGRYPSRVAPSVRNVVTKTGPAARPQYSRPRAHLTGRPCAQAA